MTVSLLVRTPALSSSSSASLHSFSSLC
jgi:hypothetical protein